MHATRRIPTFASDPLSDDLEVSGNIVLVLYASSDQTNTDFFCRLVDQAPDDEQVPGMPPKGLILTRGWLKASHAATKSEELSKPYRPYYRHDEPDTSSPTRSTGSRSRCGPRATSSRRATASASTWPAATRRRSTSAATTTASRSAPTPTTTTRSTRPTSCCP